MALENLQDLDVQKLMSGDGPSLRVVGLYAAQSLMKTGFAVFMTDALGKVHFMPPSAVPGLARPKVVIEDLDRMEEDRAIEVLVAQGDDDKAIFGYLKSRRDRLHA